MTSARGMPPRHRRDRHPDRPAELAARRWWLCSLPAALHGTRTREVSGECHARSPRRWALLRFAHARLGLTPGRAQAVAARWRADAPRAGPSRHRTSYACGRTPATPAATPSARGCDQRSPDRHYLAGSTAPHRRLPALCASGCQPHDRTVPVAASGHDLAVATTRHGSLWTSSTRVADARCDVRVPRALVSARQLAGGTSAGRRHSCGLPSWSGG